MAKSQRKPFTVRFEESLATQIQDRTIVSKRSCAAEIEYLVEYAIDEIIKKEQEQVVGSR